MRRLPEAMRAQIADVLELGGQALLGQMRARAPKRTGALARSLKYKVTPRTLKLKVGILTRYQQRNGGKSRKITEGPFYGRIQDLGRKAQIVTVHRLSATDRAEWRRRARLGGRRNVKPADLGSTYPLRVKAMAPKRFVTGRYTEARMLLRRMLKGVWERALSTIAGGGND